MKNESYSSVILTEEEKRVIFKCLTDYTSKLNDVKNEHNLESISGLSRVITRINDLAYKHFNV
jgi:hypothetical protein